MSLGKRLINTGAAAAVCATDSTDPFGDSSGVALYSLDYDASTAPDGTDYSGTPTNVDFGVEGKINYGARFNGSSSIIQSPLDLDDYDETWSISMWVKFDFNSSYRGLAGTVNSSALNGFVIDIGTSGEIRFRFRNGSTSVSALSSSSTYGDGNWHHIVVVKGATTNYLYIDDDSEVLSVATTTGITHNAQITFGRTGSYADYFKGNIDQVRIFSKALNSTEVGTLFAETACVYTSTTDVVDYPTDTTPVAYYKMDNSSEDFKGSNDGTDTNIEYRFGRFGQAADFSGSTSANIDSNISTSLGNYYSISLWINSQEATPPDWRQISGLDYNLYNYTAFIRLNTNGKIGFFGNDFTQDGSATEALSTTLINANQWYHVVGVKNGTTTKIYINGVDEGTGASSLNTLWSGSLHFGKYFGTTNQSFVGKIDQVRIYSTALDSDQVTDLYNEKPEVDTSNFKAVLYNGTSAEQYISNVGFQPDLVWMKSRYYSYNNTLYDSVRGTGTSKAIYSNQAVAENTYPTINNFVSFDANGFTVGATSSINNIINKTGDSLVAWVWKGGGDDVLNEEGSIDSQVSANTDAGFSIIKTAGGNSGASTLGHGLNYAPEMVITKGIDSSAYWWIYHSHLNGGVNPEQYGVRFSLNGDSAQYDASSGNLWNNTAPTNSVISLGVSTVSNPIIYAFHSVSGYSKIGSYTGSGSATAKPISTSVNGDAGFEPSFVMIKKTSNTGSWFMHDNKRLGTHGFSDKYLQANSNAAEVDSSDNDLLEFTDTGFTLRTTFGDYNELNGKYIYMAFK